MLGYLVGEKWDISLLNRSKVQSNEFYSNKSSKSFSPHQRTWHVFYFFCKYFHIYIIWWFYEKTCNVDICKLLINKTSYTTHHINNDKQLLEKQTSIINI